MPIASPFDERGIDLARVRGAVQTVAVFPVAERDGWFWYRVSHRKVRLGAATSTLYSRTATRIYAPDTEPDLLESALRVHTQADALDFVSRFGPIGWFRRVIMPTAAEPWSRDEKVEYQPGEYQPRARPGEDGEPAIWVQKQCELLRWTRDAWAAFTPGGSHELPRPAPSDIDLPTVAQGFESLAEVSDGKFLAALVIQDQIAVGIRALPLLEGTGDARSLRLGWVGSCLLDALWMRLLHQLAGGLVRQCEREDCRRTFVAVDPRQRFCPPPGRLHPTGSKVKSACYEIVHQRELRRRKAQARRQ